MKDTTPKIYDYIRLMQEYTPCVSEWQYHAKDGKWITASLEECLKHNQEDGADWSEVKRIRNDLKRLVEVDEYQLPDVRFGNIEINADSVEKLRVEKMIKRIVIKVDEPEPIKFINPEDCKSRKDEGKTEEDDCGELDKVLSQLEEHLSYRNYIETCNSLRLLYNLLNPVVQEYLIKRKIIAGTGYSVGGYDNLTDYYNDVSDCNNLIKNGCSRIIVSIENGTIANVSLTGRDGKDVCNIPLLDKRTDVRCRCDINEDYMCVISKRPLPEQNISLQLLNLFLDPKYQWDNVKKMTFVYEIDSDNIYTFDEVRNNIADYFEAIIKHEIRVKNKFTQEISQKLFGAYRYIYDSQYIDTRNREHAWEIACRIFKLDEDFEVSAFEYIRKIKKYILPVYVVVSK